MRSHDLLTSATEVNDDDNNPDSDDSEESAGGDSGNDDSWDDEDHGGSPTRPQKLDIEAYAHRVGWFNPAEYAGVME